MDELKREQFVLKIDGKPREISFFERVQAGMASTSFGQGPLGKSEVCLRQFAKRMRSIVPEMLEAQPPAPGWGRL